MLILRSAVRGHSAVPSIVVGRVTIYDNPRLPEDVLVEIFDAYRQLYELHPEYEKLWNSRDGWFKLTHVCLHWRRVVFLASSSLHLRLQFTPRRSSMEPMLRHLPPFPILVDYRTTLWPKKEENLALAALRHCGRVRGIALRKPFPATILRALSHPFPELESLEICSTQGHEEVLLPPTFLSGSISCLRRLTLRDTAPRCLSLLSLATGLVELDLTIVYRGPPAASLITNLQRMSCLRRFELKSNVGPFWPVTVSPPPPDSTGDVVPLPKLTDLIFIGPSTYLQKLVAGLATPSLQHLEAEVYDAPILSPIPHLCKFICDIECQFIAVRLDLLKGKVMFSVEKCSKSDRAQPFRITIPNPVSLEQIGNTLSGQLSTVEELVVNAVSTLSTQEYVILHAQWQWRGFFNHIWRVKTIQVPSSLVARGVADSFQSHGQEPALDLLPALEQIKANPVISAYVSNNEYQYESIYDLFKPLIATRKQAGRPIIFSRA